MECIEQILLDIEVDCFFDSHYIIDRALKNHSDDYLRFTSQYRDSQELTLTAHQQIGHQIANFEGRLIKRQPGESWSVNIHGNGSPCALWKRI